MVAQAAPIEGRYSEPISLVLRPSDSFLVRCALRRCGRLNEFFFTPLSSVRAFCFQADNGASLRPLIAVSDKCMKCARVIHGRDEYTLQKRDFDFEYFLCDVCFHDYPIESPLLDELATLAKDIVTIFSERENLAGR